ncbi:hypothetical protein DXN05_23255 [Deminuibacter soli]|uniref:Uncharacterized protein n=2 Tax=Deminuibacter soli TaxID=2291815 RepID=A0A3E1NCR8_9BACT|nr:hypothetical protein DXN05_23255 [Deminuibacter soli]
MTITTGVSGKLVRLLAAVKEQSANPFGLTREALRNAVFVPAKQGDRHTKPGKSKKAKINYFAGPHCGFGAHV